MNPAQAPAFAASVVHVCASRSASGHRDEGEAIVFPTHGAVDVSKETVDSDFMKEVCQRISIGISPFGARAQYAPAADRFSRWRSTLAVRSRNATTGDSAAGPGNAGKLNHGYG